MVQRAAGDPDRIFSDSPAAAIRARMTTGSSLNLSGRAEGRIRFAFLPVGLGRPGLRGIWRVSHAGSDGSSRGNPILLESMSPMTSGSTPGTPARPGTAPRWARTIPRSSPAQCRDQALVGAVSRLRLHGALIRLLIESGRVIRKLTGDGRSPRESRDGGWRRSTSTTSAESTRARITSTTCWGSEVQAAQRRAGRASAAAKSCKSVPGSRC
jgi:hypothetical protein